MDQKGVLSAAGYSKVYHFLPLHYLPYVVRTRCLLSKAALTDRGFPEHHFRSTSCRSDRDRGFGNVVHMALSSAPPILAAKLAAGFPHIGLAVPAAAVEEHGFDLCRYNIAKMRDPRRNEAEGPSETPENGRYYPPFQVPVARDLRDQRALLRRHSGEVVEVLVQSQVQLPDATQVMVYSRDDADIVWTVLNRLSCSWSVMHRPAPSDYDRWSCYVVPIHSQIDSALGDADWRGEPLEFDRLPANPRR